MLSIRDYSRCNAKEPVDYGGRDVILTLTDLKMRLNIPKHLIRLVQRSLLVNNEESSCMTMHTLLLCCLFDR